MRERGYFSIGLDNPKNNKNVGSVLRLAFNFDCSMVAVSGKRYKPSVTDTTKAFRSIPLLQNTSLKEVIPYDCVPVAVDLIPEAQSLLTYKHPERAFYIFGAEDSTLGERVLSFCRDKVFIDTRRCMNLAGAVGVVLWDRRLKRRTC